MKYKFQYEMTASDIWKLSMYIIYNSIAGVCNAIFTVAIILVAVKFLNSVNPFIAAFMILGCIWFPIIQPAILYMQAKKQVNQLPKNMELKFADGGLYVETPEEKSYIEWKQIKNVTKNRFMVVIQSGSKYGFMLSNKMLGIQKEELFNFIKEKVN